MGNQFVKDQNIEIQLIINKTIFYAGQTVGGTIYLQVKDYSQYGDIILRLQAYEKIEFLQDQGLCLKRKTLIEQTNRTYISEFSLASYPNGIYKGFYRYPFEAKLPQSFCGCMYFSQKQYLKYRLTAYLQSTCPQLTDQYFHQQILIKQPFRKLKQSLIFQQTFSPNYWWRLFSFGTVHLKVSISKNYLKPQQSFKIECLIDISRTTKKLQKFQILIQSQKLMVCKKIFKKQTISSHYEQWLQSQQVQKQLYKIERTLQVPKLILSTSIGQSIARVYVVSFICYFQSCGKIVQQCPIFVDSNNFERVVPLQKNKVMKRIKGTKFDLFKGKFRDYQKSKTNNNFKFDNNLINQKQKIKKEVKKNNSATVPQVPETSRRIRIRKDIL